VLQEIAIRAPYTAELALTSLVLAIAVGVAAGVVASTRRSSGADLAISAPRLRSPCPLLAGPDADHRVAVRLRRAARGGERRGHPLAGPATITLALFSMGLIARQTRSAMLEVLGQDFVRTARARAPAASRC